MDKKMKRNVILGVIILVVVLAGVIAFVQYGTHSSKNSPNIKINQVAGVNNVELSKTEFIPVNVTQNSTNLGISNATKGYDKYHDNAKNVYLYHIPTQTTIEMLSVNHTSDYYKKQQSNGNLTALTVANITGIRSNTLETSGNTKLFDTFYFVLGNTTYIVRYQNQTALESFLEGWVKAYNAK